MEIRRNILRRLVSILDGGERLANQIFSLLFLLLLLLLGHGKSALEGGTVLHVLLLRIDQGLGLFFVLVGASDVRLDA